jgi:SAM-dependent methyltransferase
MPLGPGSVDFVLTSPPYINVFNYHQNYRPATELLGHDPLRAARREIGANRKFRQNRFYTVVQYCLDMMLVLQDLARVTRPGGVIVVVVGRESRVRGVPFDNGLVVAALADLSSQLGLARWQERSFISRFGEKIYEEILTFEVLAKAPMPWPEAEILARGLGVRMLTEAIADSADVKADLRAAIEASPQIAPSEFSDAAARESVCPSTQGGGDVA